MKIPKSFKLAGHTINVVFVDDMDYHNGGSIGEARYSTMEIALQKPSKVTPVGRSRLEQVFLHELMHWIFYTINEHDLRKDEKVVDNIAEMLHQALTTGSKGEL